MSLNWDLSEIENKADLWTDDPEYPGHKRIKGETECIIFGCMFVGMNRITKDNWETFADRLHAWERAVAPISTSGEPIPATSVKRHIGLRTNASNETLAKFERKLGRAALSEAKRARERAKRLANAE